LGWEQIFATESDDPDVHAINEERPIASRLWFAFGCFVSVMTRWFFKMQVTGMEKLPKEGPYLLCPNHQSFLDAPILVAHLPLHSQYEDLFYVGTSDYFSHGVMKKLAHSLKLIPVDPDANLIPAMRAGAYGLKHNRILVLFPEGERSIDGIPKLFKKGAAILAYHCQVPIFPVAIAGFERAMPRGKGFAGFFPLRIMIGDALVPPAKGQAQPEATYENLTAELRSRVIAMWEKLHTD